MCCLMVLDTMEVLWYNGSSYQKFDQLILSCDSDEVRAIALIHLIFHLHSVPFFIQKKKARDQEKKARDQEKQARDLEH